MEETSYTWVGQEEPYSRDAFLKQQQQQRRRPTFEGVNSSQICQVVETESSR